MLRRPLSLVRMPTAAAGTTIPALPPFTAPLTCTNVPAKQLLGKLADLNLLGARKRRRHHAKTYLPHCFEDQRSGAANRSATTAVGTHCSSAITDRAAAVAGPSDNENQRSIRAPPSNRCIRCRSGRKR